MSGRFVSGICLALGTLFAIPSAAQQAASPAREIAAEPANYHLTTGPAPAKAVKVSILKSYGETSIWDAMSTNWQDFGKRPVTVDQTYINSDFTYKDLVNSKADVIVLSNPAGGLQQYSPDEIAAVAKYAKKGHTVIGTFVVFQWVGIDNRGLAPIFGLNSKIEYNTDEVGISNLFEKHRPKACLLKRIAGDSWQSSGYPETQVPATGSWTGHLGKAKAVAESDNYTGLVGRYDAPTYVAVYISNYPEYNGGVDDEQLLYNAVTCFAK